MSPDTLPRLRAAIGTPVNSPEDAATHSRLTEEALEGGNLQGKSRAEVEGLIGRGDPCSRHPQCEEQGFADGDWFYTVGTLGAAHTALPVFIVGFDRQGRVARTWNLRVHD
ncbi:MAG: hypothetical protein KC416_14395 [Myxococcales bacterium]|nr:hypothetical protein [Myxococcales bacterium]